jgi:hypothetical protein
MVAFSRRRCATSCSQSQGDLEAFAPVTPTFDEVLEIRAGRAGMVRDFLTAVTPDELAASRSNPSTPRPRDRRFDPVTWGPGTLTGANNPLAREV